MSLNHFPSDFSQTHWWPQPQQHEMMMMEPLNSKTTTTSSSSPSSFWPNSHHQFFSSTGHPISCSSISGLRFDLNNEEDEETQLTTEENSMKDHAVVLEEEEVDIGHEIIMPKEPLFEKPLTPSDVGKLNRLVIPKQHAEKYFPLNGVSESGEKGLLLSFEDELGKPWRFRYSYWNSSQSYVLTKGWSRFVKEKKLDAGDIVQFERHRHDCDRMFIGWRRRKNVGGGSVHQAAAAAAGLAVVSSSTGGNGRWQPYPPQTTFHGPAALSLPYPPPASVHAAAAGGGESRTITAASGNCKRLRLFGVNMECQPDDDSVSSNQFPGPGPGPGPGPSPPDYPYYPKLLHVNYHHPNHTEVDYPGDISQSRYQQG